MSQSGSESVAGITAHIVPGADVRILTIHSGDGTNRLSRERARALTAVVRSAAEEPLPLVITGTENFFSAGADLNEISKLTGAEAFDFARMGQQLMDVVDQFPAPVIAAVRGYCMGGGLDLALACDYRIAAPNAIFGHRGAALGIMTGWGGTQRLPRLIGKPQAMQMFLAAGKLHARQALRIGLADAIADDPCAEALRWAREKLRWNGNEYAKTGFSPRSK